MCKQAPPPVWEIFEAGWNRATALCGLLTDACRSLLPAIPSLRDHSVVTLPLLQRHHREFLTACQHISRYGTAYRAFWDLWQDVVLPRSKKILGTPGSFSCPLCQQALPSIHALAAHTHRKHSVVNSLTLFTAGTVCLWCHVEHHSTDRLKYHLKRTPSCVHGLRVTVGRSYTYGSGTKRRGAQAHRGMPPIRLPGPRNATPAQRAAALHGRQATPAELSAELRTAAGVDDVYSWPDLTITPERSVELSPPSHNLFSPSPPPGAALDVPSDSTLRYWRIADAFEEGSRSLPSPLWSGLARQTICWGLPRAWHRWWRLWLAADIADNPWDSSQRAATKPLRPPAQRSIAQHSFLPAATRSQHCCFSPGVSSNPHKRPFVDTRGSELRRNSASTKTAPPGSFPDRSLPRRAGLRCSTLADCSSCGFAHTALRDLLRLSMLVYRTCSSAIDSLQNQVADRRLG